MAVRSLAIAALGDSITAGTPSWDPDPRVREVIGEAADERHQWPYWVERTQPFVRVRNLGVNMQRTDEIRAPLDEALVEGDVVVIQGGINDVVQGRDPAATLSDLRQMAQQAKGAGRVVAIANVLPWNNGYPEHAPTITRLNEEIAELARSERIDLLDFYSALEDERRRGRMRDQFTGDGNHPSVAGHRILAEVVSEFISEMHDGRALD